MNYLAFSKMSVRHIFQLEKEEKSSSRYQDDVADLKKKLNQERHSREKVINELEKARKKIEELEESNRYSLLWFIVS